ncbi:hypothetical protein PSQ90_03630 [Devosia rhodophyticola]|uniref:Uncharacterized protein n=1 Tax=Devosia rhodophyticola TaxID=3026423 RepID=A0ABY7YZY0_9HYPH|nr:hypothetical protein [Devosia rhodophyticola]WDR06565.1 hypothetical protein PSQ90_03630 [Devosia rhodophyticola]
MAGELMTGMTIFKSLLDTASGLKDIHDATLRDQVAFMLQKQILEAQAAQFALVEEVGNLKTKLSKLENWETEKLRYKLERQDPGVFMYGLKPDMDNGEPDHKLCATCYNDGQKSILHTDHGSGLTYWKCQKCGFEEHSGRFNISGNRNEGAGWMGQ